MWCLGALLIGASSVLVLQSAGLVPAPLPPETSPVQEASLRLVIYRDIQRVEAYRRTNGRLPLTVTEASLPAEARYTVPTADRSSISEASGPLRPNDKSKGAPAALLANSYDVSRGGIRQ